MKFRQVMIKSCHGWNYFNQSRSFIIAIKLEVFIDKTDKELLQICKRSVSLSIDDEKSTGLKLQRNQQ